MYSIGQLSHDWIYYSVAKITHVRGYSNLKNIDSVYENIFIFDQNAKNYLRIAYNFLNFIGDIAGIYDLIFVVVGFFIFPISKHSFFLSAMKKMFLVKTMDSHIFEQKIKQKDGKLENQDVIKRRGITKYLARETVDYIEDQKLKQDVIDFHRKISLT